MSTYYPTNSNGNGYDNTGSYNTRPSGSYYDDTPLTMGSNEQASDYSSSGPSDTSSIYNNAASSTPVPAVRSPGSYTRTSKPYAGQSDDDFNRGYSAGYEDARRSLAMADPGAGTGMTGEGSSSSPPRQTQVQHTTSMLHTDPYGVDTGPTSKYQNQFAPNANNSRVARSGMVPTDNAEYEHGGMPVNSSALPSTGLTTTGVGAGKKSGRSGNGIGRQPGLANVNSGMGAMEAQHRGRRGTGTHLGSGNAMESKPGTGGWKGAAKRLARHFGGKNE